MAATLPRASLVDDARFNSLFVVPQAVQGLFRRHEVITSALSPLDLDGHVIDLIDGLRRNADDGAVRLHLLRDPAVLLLAEADIRRVLEGSPDPYAPDPPTKRRGMGHFQPDALTLSRGEQWRVRRAFNEHVLDTGRDRHRFADHFEAVARAEIARLLLDRTVIGWADWHRAGQRIARRVVLGEAAADDDHVTDLLARLMAEANRLPSAPSPLLDRLLGRLEGYAAAAEPGSLVARFADAPADARTAAVGQVPHWLFALADTLPMNSFRALALLSTHTRHRADARSEADSGGLPRTAAVLEEAMRLWPTTPVLARVALRDVTWNGERVPAGTQFLIVNTYHHRNTRAHPWADRCVPEAWTSDRARGDWTFNHLSNGPQGCPGAGLVRLIGSRTLATVLRAVEPRLRGAVLDAERPLPRTLDVFGLRFSLAQTPGRPPKRRR